MHQGDISPAEAYQRLQNNPSAVLIDVRTQPEWVFVGVPAVEVHISDPDAREPFRRVSYVRAACIATVKGRGLDGYVEALRLLCGKD